MINILSSDVIENCRQVAATSHIQAHSLPAI